MVNVFPDLLTFGLLAPTIIRLFLGAYFVVWGLSALRKTNAIESTVGKKIIGGLGIVAGISVVIGFETQIGALMLAAFSLYFGKHATDRLPYILLFGMAVSLLFSGAGFLAFDLPL